MAESAQSPAFSVFGKYLLDEEIARGGMARVFRARLRGLGGFEKTLVVKQVLPELARDPRFVSMFVEEAKTLVQMSHPHVVPVYELGVVDGVYFLAMEYVEGATLAQILREEGALSPAQVAHVGLQVADALAYAHERFGIVHRDVTPRNVMVDATGHVRLVDFGIAAPATGSAEGEVFGSHGYMAPEQARGETISAKSDVFALGAVLYEALTGTPAFLRASHQETQVALFAADPPRFSEHEGTPEALGAILQPLLSVDPDARTDARTIARKLRAWLASTSPEGVAAEVGDRAAATLAAGRRSRPIATIATPTDETGTGVQETSRIVKTIATSRILDDLVQSPAPATATDPDPAPAGTVRISREPVPATVTPPLVKGPGPLTSAAPLAWMVGGLFAAGAVAIAVIVGSSNDSEPVTPPPAARDRTPSELPGPQTDPQRTQTTPQLAIDAGPTRTDPTPPVATAATVTINAMPWAEVRLNGRRLGTTPRRNVSIPIGNHTLEIENPALDRRARVPLRVTSARRITVLVDLSRDPPSVTIR